MFLLLCKNIITSFVHTPVQGIHKQTSVNYNRDWNKIIIGYHASVVLLQGERIFIVIVLTIANQTVETVMLKWQQSYCKSYDTVI